VGEREQASSTTIEDDRAQGEPDCERHGRQCDRPNDQSAHRDGADHRFEEEAQSTQPDDESDGDRSGFEVERLSHALSANRACPVEDSASHVGPQVRTELNLPTGWLRRAEVDGPDRHIRSSHQGPTMGRGRLAQSLVFATLVVLAGCAGLAGEDSSSAETLTPAPVPTAGPTYPPGVTASGVAPAVLADAHESRLLSAGFTLTSHRRLVGPGGMLGQTHQSRRVAPGGETYVGEFTQSAPKYPLQSFPRLSLGYWTNGTVTAYNRESARPPQSYAWVRGEPPTLDVTRARALERYLTAVETTVRQRDRGVVLAGSTVDQPGAIPRPPDVERPRNVSLTVRVDADGIVTDWRLAYSGTVANRTVRIVETGRITDVGRTTVEYPDWVAAAAEARWTGV